MIGYDQQTIAAPGWMGSAPGSSPAPAPGIEERAASTAAIVDHFRRRRMVGDHGAPAQSYSRVSALYACVKAKSLAHSMLPLMHSSFDDEVLESGPLVDLAACPNAATTGRQFWEATSAFMDLHGAAHWLFILDGGGRPAEVQVVSPVQMEARVNQRTGELVGWTFRPAGRLSGLRVDLSPAEVFTVTDPDFDRPERPWEGLSPRQAARMAVAQYFNADVANLASLDNGVEPGGLLTMDGVPGEDQIRALREEMIERHSGPANRRRFLIVYGGMKWQQMGAGFADMEFTELKKMSREDIAAVFGCPPAVLGWFADSNRAHADAAQEMFWINTILPRAARFAEAWELAVVARFENDRSLATAEARRRALGELDKRCHGYRTAVRAQVRRNRRLFAWFDSSDIPAVRAAKMSQSIEARNWIGVGVTLNNAIRAFDLPFEEQPWGDDWWRPIGLVSTKDEPLGFPSAGDGDGAGESDLLEPPGSRSPAPSGRGKRSGQLPGAVADIERAVPERVRARLWEQWRASWAALERTARGRARRHFNGLRNETLRRLREAVPRIESARSAGQLPIRGRDLIGEILFDLVKANDGLLKLIGPILREGARLGGEQSVTEAAEAQGLDPEDAQRFNLTGNTLAKLRAREVEIAGVNRTLRAKLSESLAEGIEANETIDQLAERVRTKFNVADGRAKTIAMTEVGGAVEDARADGREQAGVPMKSWLSSRKETGRPTHRATEVATMAQPIDNAEDFVIAGTAVTAPHPRASGRPEHDINCGCTTLSRFEGDSIRSIVQRYQRHGFLTYEQLAERDRRTRKAAPAPASTPAPGNEGGEA